MPNTVRRSLALASLFALGLVTACDGGKDAAKEDESAQNGANSEEGAEADAGASEAAAGETAAGKAAEAKAELFDESMKTKPCELLTANMVAGVLGVDEGGLTQSSPMKGMCSYATDDDTSIMIGFITVRDDLDKATEYFDNAYKGMSPEEVEKAMAAIEKELDKQVEEGKVEAPDAKKAEPVKDAVGGAFAAGFKYEDVEGVGDAARLGVTKRKIAGMEMYDNEIYVRVRNLSFQIQVEKEKQDVLHRDELIAAAKAVVKGL